MVGLENGMSASAGKQIYAAVAAFERVQIAFAPPLVLSSPTYVWGRARAAFLANLGRVTTEGGVGEDKHFRPSLASR